ncbi:MAG: beta-ketoacyl synthase chain length factor [Bacteroidales bacterium]|jgi:3-oxoacyl-(acyl-carrier-protein) synthase|nr:beta-ketoacyl synthase chain length factor [Bacteroidales bacterium]MDD3273620.1 beta-ketoacyl synthase chain length factor [Bacteroidales bacterium]MDD4058342.1 beta-ketoacyl synthase chain length factor [Bacteroidales bacterium]
MKTNLYILGAAGISQNEPDYKDFIQDAGLRRRMSRVIRMSVASSIMAMREAAVDKFDAIVTGTGWGCLADTEKFLVSIIQNNERLLNPSSFIQSTSNTVGAQIALMLGDNHYNNTFVHGSSSFESALTDAALLVSEGKHLVLAGGFDELTSTKRHLLGRMGMWREHKGGEGAAFFVLASEPTSKQRGVIKSVEILSLNETYNEICNKAEKLVNGNTLFMCGDVSIASILNERGFKSENYKEITGEFPTASALALFFATERLAEDNEIEKIVLVNKFIKDSSTVIELVR